MSILSIILAPALAHSPAGKVDTPPPPVQEYEFFGPTLRDHSTSTRCGINSATIGWKYDGRKAVFTEFKFQKNINRPEDLHQLNLWASEMTGDLFLIVSCGNNGVNVAISEINYAGVRPSRQIRTIYDGARFRLAKRLNFD